MPGNSDSNAGNLLKRILAFRLVQKDGKEYVKTVSPIGVNGVDGVTEQEHSTRSTHSMPEDAFEASNNPDASQEAL